MTAAHIFNSHNCYSTATNKLASVVFFTDKFLPKHTWFFDQKGKFLRDMSCLKWRFFETSATNFVKVRSSHFWTIFNGSNIFLIFEQLIVSVFDNIFTKKTPLNLLKPLMYFEFKNILDCNKTLIFVLWMFKLHELSIYTFKKTN